MMSYCAVRIAKHKRIGDCIRVVQHHERSQLVANSYSELARNNIHEGAGSENLSAAWQREVDRRYTSRRKMRSDAVKVIELMCIYSPEATAWIDPHAWHRSCKSWVAKRFGGSSNLLASFTHLDETTPHFHCIVVPLVNGRLSARDLIGGKSSALAQLQTDFADSVGKKFNLSRGQYGSKKHHIPPGEWRRMFAQEQRRKIIAETKLSVSIERQLGTLSGFSCEEVATLISANGAIKTRGIPKPDCPIEYASAMSGMPRESVVRWLQAVDPTKLRVTLQHEAMRRVERELSSSEPMPIAEQADWIAKPSDSKWLAARQTLESNFRIPLHLIDSLHARRRIFATEAGEIAFGLTPLGTNPVHATGYLIIPASCTDFSKSTGGRFIGDPLQSFFQIGNGGQRLVIAANPIEALSFFALYGGRVLSLSTQSSALPSALSNVSGDITFALPHAPWADLIFADAQSAHPHARRLFPDPAGSFNLKLKYYDESATHRARKSQQGIKRSQRAIAATYTVLAIAAARKQRQKQASPIGERRRWNLDQSGNCQSGMRI